MKNVIVYLILLCVGSTFCNEKSSDNVNVNYKSGKTDVEKNVSKRDTHINPSNSFSDLFFDSLVMEKFISEKNLPDSIVSRLRSFYNTRNYQFAWFNSDGFTEQALAFWNLHQYVTYNFDTSLRDKSLQKKINNLLTQDSPSISTATPSYINIELSLTDHFLRYMLSNYEKGFVKWKEMERFIPREKLEPMYVADSLLNKRHEDNEYFEDINEPYKLLKVQLDKYYKIAKEGGWLEIYTNKKTLKKGTSSSEIVTIKRRLQITGDMPGTDTTQFFDDTLETEIKNFQTTLGYKGDGVITKQLIEELNVPVENRIQQILINMDRMRWMPAEREGNLIVVNIPEFVLDWYEGHE